MNYSNKMKDKHKVEKILAYLMIIVGLSILIAETNMDIVDRHATNEVNQALHPFTIEDCTEIRWYRNDNTNPVSPTELKPGDKVVVIVDISAAKLPAETNVILSDNIVGFIRVDIPTNPITPTNLKTK